MQTVPTGVVKGPDGALYMSQLTGFPFPVGAANVYRIDPRSGNVSVYAAGFTNIIDLDFGKDGTLYVLEIDHDRSAPARRAVERRRAVHRRLARQDAASRSTLPAGTLTNPGGVAVGKRGHLYVTNRSTEAGDGEVLKLDLR